MAAIAARIGVITDQRVRPEMAVEAGAIGRADAGRGIGEDMAPAAVQIAHGERRHLARDQARQQVHAGVRVRGDIARRLGDGAEQIERSVQVESGDQWLDGRRAAGANTQNGALPDRDAHAETTIAATSQGAGQRKARPWARRLSERSLGLASGAEHVDGKIVWERRRPTRRSAFNSDDIATTTRGLKARGVEFAGCELPGLRTVGHVCVLGAEKAAWFNDPEGNILYLHQELA